MRFCCLYFDYLFSYEFPFLSASVGVANTPDEPFFAGFSWKGTYLRFRILLSFSPFSPPSDILTRIVATNTTNIKKMSRISKIKDVIINGKWSQTMFQSAVTIGIAMYEIQFPSVNPVFVGIRV